MNYIQTKIVSPLQKHWFLFQELVKRDFKKKYKGTFLGMLWSILSPLLELLVMRLIFTRFFGRGIDHYTTYLFAGNLIFSFYSESTNGGMSSLVSNSSIFSKVNVPKYLFLLSRNISALINFFLNLLVFFLFAALDHITFSWRFFTLIYPIGCLIVFNIGVGMVLSALYVFFRDTGYLYSVFILLLRYMSAIFYTTDNYGEQIQRLFLINPVYCYIKYFRVVVIGGTVPSLSFHLLCAGYAIFWLLIGSVMYKKLNTKFLYYI